MAFAAPTKNKQATTNLAKSTWTPMNNSEANLQVFQERRELLKKWFEKWGEKQRRTAVDDVVKCLSEKHLFALLEQLTQKFPQEKYDFTKRLPRVLSLYVFSFLDPRSLCRCAQVSWYWKYLTELDCLWRPKCLRFGWYPTHQPSQYEETVWKRYYVSTLYQLHYVKAKADKPEKCEEKVIPDSARSLKSQLSTTRSNVSSASRKKRAQIAPKYVALPGPKWEQPPWKGSDPHPIDTMRYNYLDNSAKDKKKSKERRRPNSASGSILISSRNHSSPVKSSGEPRPSSSASVSRNKVASPSVAQSLDPRVLGTGAIHSGGTLATSRNIMSSSVSHLTYTGNTSMAYGSPGLHGHSLDGGTLAASTYYVNSTSPLYSSVDGKLKTSSQYVSSTPLHGQTPEQSPQHTLSETSPLRMADAGKRPQPAVRMSTEKQGTMTAKQADTVAKDAQSPSKEITNVAVSTAYQVKSSGKSTPLQGSPWKPPENNISDDD